MHQQPRIMCAVDLSWRSQGALNHAIALAKWWKAPLDVLFAVSDRYPFGLPPTPAGRGSLPNSVNALPRLTST